MASIRSSSGSRRAAALLAWLGLFSTSGPARAEDADGVRARRFRELYAQATRSYSAKDYTAAIPLLQAAFAIEPVPQLLFNIAQAYRKLEQWSSARVYFELYRSTDKEMPQEKSDQIDAIVLELREQEQRAQAPRVKVVEKTKLVYVEAQRPIPRWVRPLGIAAGVAGLGLVGGGAGLLALNGRCGSDPVAPALECDQVYATRNPGLALTVVGGSVLLFGVVAFGVSFKRPAPAKVVGESAAAREAIPTAPRPVDPDFEPAPAGEQLPPLPSAPTTR